MLIEVERQSPPPDNGDRGTPSTNKRSVLLPSLRALSELLSVLLLPRAMWTVSMLAQEAAERMESDHGVQMSCLSA